MRGISKWYGEGGVASVVYTRKLTSSIVGNWSLKAGAGAIYEGTVKHIYFVAETKGSMNSMQLRLIEESKIHCAKEHFKAISNGEVVYDVVDSYKTLLDMVTR